MLGSIGSCARRSAAATGRRRRLRSRCPISAANRKTPIIPAAVAAASGVNSSVTPDLQRRSGPARRPSPGQDIHRSGRERRRAGERERVHAKTLVNGEHGRHGHHEGAGADAVQMDDRRNRGGAEHDLERILADETNDPGDNRLEQPGIVHHAKVRRRRTPTGRPSGRRCECRPSQTSRSGRRSRPRARRRSARASTRRGPT